MNNRPEPIAVIGTGFRFPGCAKTASKLWGLLRDPPDLLTPITDDRFSARGFYHRSGQYHGHSNVQDSYLLSEDNVQRRFDAQFFGISPAEANIMDPQMRLLLEAVYEALEAGGQTIEGLQGSDTAVYAGLMRDDYKELMIRDIDGIGTYHATGTTRSLMSNRVSYFFDWHGPSMTIDTACSSSLIAVHQAVQQLRSSQSRVAIAAGANLILDPQYYIVESKLQMLSPDSRSRMWDSEANGYARGEGIAAVVLKTLSAAEADGDHIECVIREIGTNQDGRTKGITLPSAVAQAQLIQDCYARAGLQTTKIGDRPQYFEAHGTGTPAGDPIEAEAISVAFPPLQDAVLHVGSVKTVMGHSEGAAGLAALIKASLALQNAVIPPNLLFSHLNPKVEPFYTNLRIPTLATPWPELPHGTPRRASVNSFGFSGANAHAILESYVTPRQLPATTNTTVFTPFVFSAAAESSLVSYIASFNDYLRSNGANEAISLRDLAYTLHSRRTNLPFAAAVAASSISDLCAKLDGKLEASRLDASKPVGIRAAPNQSLKGSKHRILGVFTGQGAQWAHMGSELIVNSTAARRILQSLEDRLSRLPPGERPAWSLIEELQKESSSSRIGEALMSQPLCTAIQILQVDLLRAAGIDFATVVGHSSGEIAAAYAAGFISADNAICIAYYRGLHCGLARGQEGQHGSMMAVGSSFEDVQELCELPEFEGRISIAAINSSNSVTVAGDQDAIEELKIILEDEEKFARLLKVEKAYHSHHMIPCSEPYLRSLRALNILVQSGGNCSWHSSVHGEDMSHMTDKHESLKSSYWDSNMQCPVLFMQAVQSACASSSFDLAIEVGPHPALKSPALETLRSVSELDIPYTGLFSRGRHDVESVADGLGYIWTHLGKGSVDFQAYDSFVSENAPAQLMKGLPTYSWNHENEYWHESRYARAVRTRPDPVHELLGHLTPDSTQQEMRWRHLLRPKEVPWLKGHRLQDQTVFPAAGYVIAAVEASIAICRGASINIIEIVDLDIGKALTFNHDESSCETIFSLTNILWQSDKIIDAQFKYNAATGSQGDSLDLLASGSIRVLLGEYDATALSARGPRPPNMTTVQPDDFYSSLAKIDYEYSGPFAALGGLERKLGTATGFISNLESSEMLVHPAVLDASFQSILLAHSYPGDGSLWSMHVPRAIKCIRINPQLCRTKMVEGKALAFDAMQPEFSTGIAGDVYIYPDDLDHAMIQVEGLDCVPFSPATPKEDKMLFSAMVWDVASPDLGLVAYDGLATPDQYRFASLLERVAGFYLRALDRDIPADHTSRFDGPHVSLFRFASHVRSLAQAGELPLWKAEWEHDTIETISTLCEPYANMVDFKLLCRIGENLSAIAEGKKQAIEIGMADGLLTPFYENAMGMPVYTRYLARAVKQIVHRYPHMHVLEIGAGTGSATKGIFAMVDPAAFASYTYTDVTSGFFSAAQTTFDALNCDRMIFKVLDISRNPREQGFIEPHSYDMLVASLVLHATPFLEETLRNARYLLKPGGYLVVLEGLPNNATRVGTTFGGFPGWWLGANEGRILTPCISLAEWAELLRKTGFSGCDTVTPDPDPLVMPVSLFVSQAVDDKVSFLRDPLSSELFPPGTLIQNLLLLGGTSLRTSRLLSQLKPLLRPYCNCVKNVRSVEDLSTLDISSTTTVLNLADLDEPFFKHLDERKWEAMKIVLMEARSILWITHGRRSDNPYSNMPVGLLRSSIRELPSLNCQFLEIEDIQKMEARILAEALLRLEGAISWQQDGAQDSIQNTIEPELILDKQGRFLVPRLVPNQEMNDRYNSQRRDIVTKKPLGVENFGIEMSKSGIFIQQEPIPALEEQMQANYSVLSAIKVSDLGCMFMSLGRNLYSEEQTLILSTKNTRILPSWTKCSVPIKVDVGSEATFLTLVIYYMLASSTLKGLSKGDSIVVFESTPAFARILSKEASLGDVTVVFITRCTAPDNPNWLTIQYTTPERVIRSLLPKRIAVYLDFSADLVERCIGDRIRTQIPLHCKFENMDTMFARESWYPLGSHVDDVLGRLRNAAINAEHSLGDTGATTSLQIPVIASGDLSELGSGLGPLSIVDWVNSTDFSIRVQPIDSYPLFSESSTYWLAGLSGGLGLSLCEWMIRHGARTFVLSSRNPSIQEAWLKKMDAAGAIVKVCSCDNTKKNEVIALHSWICSNLPPIAGVAQGSMVLQDTAFRNMTLDILAKVTRPKVEGSVHLNDLFQKDTLEFFVFFSSFSAVVGSPGQSNYSAANLFMSSLAEQRCQKGLAASIINIGPILGVGYIAQEQTAAKAIDARSNEYVALSERDFHQLFAEAVVSGRARSGRVIEITAGARRISPDEEEQPGWASNPIMSHLVLNRELLSQAPVSARTRVPFKTQLAQAQTRAQVSMIIMDSFVPKLGALFQLSAEKLADADLHSLRLDEMGIDSLLATEIRSWFIKTFEVNIPVLQILSGAAVGELVAVATEKIPVSLVPNLQPDVPLVALEASELQVPDSPSNAVASHNDLDETPGSSSSLDEQPSSTSLASSKLTSSGDDNQKHFISKPILIKSLPLSLSQEMFWFVWSLVQDKTSLNHSASFRLTGRLRIDDLKDAVQAIGQQHETLRTCFLEKDSKPTQGIMELSTLHLEDGGHVTYKAKIEQKRGELQNYVFDLKRGETMRIVLLSLSSNLHYLVLGAHGLVMDGMSFQVFMKDLQLHYLHSGLTLETTRQFSDYSEKQHDEYAAGKYENMIRFWRTQFPDFPPPLPILRVSETTSRPFLKEYDNERFDVRIDSETRTLIQAVCRRYRVTAFHFYLAIFRVLLSRYTDAEDVSIGIGDANRFEDDLMDSIGMFLNLLPLRFRTKPSARFDAILEETRSQMYSALANSRVPFQVLLNELDAPRSATHTPIFQCFVNYRQGQREKMAWADCQLEMMSFQASKSAYDLALDIIDNADSESLLMFVVRKDIYDKQAVAHLAKSYERLVKSFAADPDASLSQPSIFESAEIEEAMQFSLGPSYVSQWPETIVRKFDDVAKMLPQEIAILLDDGSPVTYESLSDHSNSIAAALQASKVTTAAVVAVLQEPTAAWVASMLAIMRIGAVYLPLDLSNPWERLAAIVLDCRPIIVLVDNDTQQHLLQLHQPYLPSINVATLELGKPHVRNSSTANSTAMILYTSGSTGLPKGIILKHEGLRNWIEPTAHLYGIGREVVLQQSSANFDMSFTQIASALCFGGILYLLPRRLRADVQAITEAIASRGITYTCATPSEYSSWLRYSNSPERLRDCDWKLAICAGEPVVKSLLLQLANLDKSDLRFFNMYGPTEISLVATAMELSYRNQLNEGIAAGHTLPNYSVYVVDEQMRLVAPGIQGEIYIGGAGVASAYLGNAILTAERFVPDVFATEEFAARGWKTMHRTGDVGRWRKDGAILIEGRISGDTQIKLRGVRMDLREIEKAIMIAADGVLSGAVITVHSKSPDSPEFLVAHVVFDHQLFDDKVQAQFLRGLQSRLILPQNMHPAMIIPLGSLPITSSSKLDRKAISALSLPEKESFSELSNGEGQRPSSINLTETEARLKEIWEDVVPSPTITMLGLTPQTDFFHVGGTSMFLLDLQARIRMIFGIELPLPQMFESSTLAGMARRISNSIAEVPEALLDWDKETDLPPALLNFETADARTVVPATYDKVIVLTGATGFLGRALLASLIADPRVATIHCIAVRNASIRYEISGLAKVVIHQGDLNLPRLGLSEIDAQAIFSTADIIMHNGADVSYLKGYPSLRIANIQSTKELATLCLPRQIPFHYISTAGVAMFAATALGTGKEFAAASAAPYPPPLNLTVSDFGHNYTAMTATKWASERFLERIVTERFRDWPVFMHRPSLIERQDSNSHGLDLVSNIRYYAHRIGAVPVILTGADGERSRGRLNQVPLDAAVRGILLAALKDSTTGQSGDGNEVHFLHHLGRVELPLGDIRSWVHEDSGDVESASAMQELPIGDWAKKAGECGMHNMMIMLLESLTRGTDVVFPKYSEG